MNHGHKLIDKQDTSKAMSPSQNRERTEYAEVVKHRNKSCNQMVDAYYRYFIEVEQAVKNYNPYFQNISHHLGNFQQKIKIVNIEYSKTYQFITVDAKLGSFTAKIRILNSNHQSTFHKCQPIGFGSFSNVYKIPIYISKQQNNYAVKCFSIEQANTQTLLLNVLQQIILLRVANSVGNRCISIDNNPLSFDVIYYSKCIEIVMDLCSWEHKLMDSYQFDLKLALRSMHTLGMVHCDIKPENTAFNPILGKWVFLDFGLSRIIQESIQEQTQTYFTGTLSYCCPSMLALSNLSNSKGFVNLYLNDLYSLKLSVQSVKKGLNCQINEVKHAPIYQQAIQQFVLLTKIKYIINGNFTAHYKSLLQQMNGILSQSSYLELFQFLSQLASTNEIKPFLQLIPYSIKQTLNYIQPNIFTNKFTQKQVKQQKLLLYQQRYQHLKHHPSASLNCQLNECEITNLLLNQNAIKSCSTQIYFTHLISYISFNHNKYHATLNEKTKICLIFETVYLGKSNVAYDSSSIERTVQYLLHYCLTPKYNQWKCQHLNEVFVQYAILGLATTEQVINILQTIPKMNQNIETVHILFQLTRENLVWVKNTMLIQNHWKIDLLVIQEKMWKELQPIQQKSKLIRKQLKNKRMGSDKITKTEVILRYIDIVYHLSRRRGCLISKKAYDYCQQFETNVYQYTNSKKIRNIQSDFMFRQLMVMVAHSLIAFFGRGISLNWAIKIIEQLKTFQKQDKFEYYHFTIIDVYLKINKRKAACVFYLRLKDNIKDDCLLWQNVYFLLFKIKQVPTDIQNQILPEVNRRVELLVQQSKNSAFSLFRLRILLFILKQKLTVGYKITIFESTLKQFSHNYFDYQFDKMAANITESIKSYPREQQYLNLIMKLYFLMLQQMIKIKQTKSKQSCINYFRIADSSQIFIPFNHNIKYIQVKVTSNRQPYTTNSSTYYKQTYYPIPYQLAISAKQTKLQQIIRDEIKPSDLLQFYEAGHISMNSEQSAIKCRLCLEKDLILTILHQNITIFTLLASGSNRVFLDLLKPQYIRLEKQQFSKFGGQVMHFYVEYLVSLCCYLKTFQQQCENKQSLIIYLKQYYSIIKTTGEHLYFRLFQGHHSIKIAQVFKYLMSSLLCQSYNFIQEAIELIDYFLVTVQEYSNQQKIIQLRYILEFQHEQEQQLMLTAFFNVKWDQMKVHSNGLNSTNKCYVYSIILSLNQNHSSMTNYILKMNKELEGIFYQNAILIISFYYLVVLSNIKLFRPQEQPKRYKHCLSQLMRSLIINEKGDVLICYKQIKNNDTLSVNFFIKQFVNYFKLTSKKYNQKRRILIKKIDKKYSILTRIKK